MGGVTLSRSGVVDRHYTWKGGAFMKVRHFTSNDAKFYQYLDRRIDARRTGLTGPRLDGKYHDDCFG